MLPSPTPRHRSPDQIHARTIAPFFSSGLPKIGNISPAATSIFVEYQTNEGGQPHRVERESSMANWEGLIPGITRHTDRQQNPYERDGVSVLYSTAPNKANSPRFWLRNEGGPKKTDPISSPNTARPVSLRRPRSFPAPRRPIARYPDRPPSAPDASCDAPDRSDGETSARSAVPRPSSTHDRYTDAG